MNVTLRDRENYTSYRYVAPLRPTVAISPAMLGFYQDRKWIAQVKKNGTNNVIFVGSDGSIRTKTRHNTDHKAWHLTYKSGEIIKHLINGKHIVLNAELLHSKTKHIKDTNFIHDILVFDNRTLEKFSFSERYNLLYNLLGKFIKREMKDHFILNDNTWLAKNFDTSFQSLYDSLSETEDEGLVLKNPYGFPNDRTWTVKCRKQAKNYSF